MMGRWLHAAGSDHQVTDWGWSGGQKPTKQKNWEQGGIHRSIIFQDYSTAQAETFFSLYGPALGAKPLSALVTEGQLVPNLPMGGEAETQGRNKARNQIIACRSLVSGTQGMRSSTSSST